MIECDSSPALRGPRKKLIGINRLLTVWKEYMNNPFTALSQELLRKFRARRINRIILKEIHSLRDERVAHINSMKPLKEHLEQIESRNLARDINLDKYSNSLLRDSDNKNINDKFYEDLKLYREEQFEKNKHNENFSPLPRHDTTNFNKLTMAEDLRKKIQHPNPELQGNDKFNFIFRNKLNFQEHIIFDQDDYKDDPEVF